jgi:hypothetical protein
MKTIEDFIKKTNIGLKKYTNRPELVLNDGFKMSVQASSHHYCTPRFDFLNKYTSVEIGFPNKKEVLILENAENPNTPTETVYDYVDCNIVNKVIEKHGGINSIATFLKLN